MSAMKFLSIILFSVGLGIQGVEVVAALDVEIPGQAGQLLQHVIYPFVQQQFSGEGSIQVLDKTCSWKFTSGFYRWQWTYDGHISCPGLGDFERLHCKSRACAIRVPLENLLKAIIQQHPELKQPLIDQLRSGPLNEADKNSLISTIS